MSNPLVIDLYGGELPEDIPVYLISEVAHHLRLSVSTLNDWAFGRDYPTQQGSSSTKPIILVADPSKKLLSFNNLMELHVLSSIRKTHKVGLPAIRRAVNFLRDQFGTDRPLIDGQMFTDGKDLFVENFAHIVNASRNGQIEMKQVLSAYLNRIDRNPAGLPIRLFPFTRAMFENSPRYVAIDPRIRFGAPCISGTRIPTRVISERYRAGDTTSLLAKDYERTIDEIEEVVYYESRTAA